MSSALLSRPGAVQAEGLDAGVAWHYGEPVAEQRLLEKGEGVVDLSNRDVLTVTGADRLTWLDTLSTQWLRDLTPGQSREALILSPHGHVEHNLHLFDDGEAVWITTEPGHGEALLAHLQRMRFMLRVEPALVTAEWAVIGEPTREAASLAWVDPWPAMVGDSASYCVVPDPAHPGWERSWRERLVPRADLADAVGDRPSAGTWAADALRVAAWRPRLGMETDHRTIPHEVDWLRTSVHLHKGCYRGQETMARVHNLGKPPRRLVMLHLDGSGHDIPQAGAELLLEPAGRAVGRITTVARHHEMGPVALAVVKRNLATDAVLLAGSVAGAQEVVVSRG